MECYEALSDDDIESHVACGSKGNKEFRKMSWKWFRKSLTDTKLNHGDA